MDTTPAPDSPPRVLMATGNPHKVEEIRAIFRARAREEGAEPAFNLVGLDAVPSAPEPHETGATFEQNAELKARYWADRTGLWCMADDSGLEVDPLGGEPGVRSARYAGFSGPRQQADLANNRRLLQRLGEIPGEQRTARFVCAMVLAAPGPVSRTVHIVRGTVEGRILGPGDPWYDQCAPAMRPRGRGEHGFGYDPLFLLPGRGLTTAELAPMEKNRISHRGRASRVMYFHLQRAIEQWWRGQAEQQG